MEIAAIFNDSQDGVSVHRRCCVELKKIQEQSSRGKSEEAILQGEQHFIFSFIKNVNHVLAAKKSDEWADKVMKFIIIYLQFSYQKGILIILDLSYILSFIRAEGQIYGEPWTLFRVSRKVFSARH